jgi:hypothetical protein
MNTTIAVCIGTITDINVCCADTHTRGQGNSPIKIKQTCH